jgi:hypothetical protein
LNGSQDLKGAALRKARSVTVEHEDGDMVYVYEVREPSLKVRDEFMRRMAGEGGMAEGVARGSLSEAQAYLAIACSFHPGTETRVFSMDDLPALMESPTGGIVVRLGEAAAGFFSNKARAKLGKGFAATLNAE